MASSSGPIAKVQSSNMHIFNLLLQPARRKGPSAPMEAPWQRPCELRWEINNGHEGLAAFGRVTIDLVALDYLLLLEWPL